MPGIFNVSLTIPAQQVTALMGPSGCGKSTFLRCLNRLHEEIPGSTVSGTVLVNNVDIYAPHVPPRSLRRHMGMVFQRPNPLPTRSIFENVAIGLRMHGIAGGKDLQERVEQTLRQVVLWDEVKDRLQVPASDLSGGQQQRLCIARTLALDPQVVLMDEPTSALDPIATLHIEDLIRTLQKTYTIVIVTHNLQQASRIANQTAFFLEGKLIEVGETRDIFERPRQQETQDYITGRFS
jgi:phosphate transport system ATP-binding protein